MPLHDRTERWACVVAHRRAGKTVACVNELIKACLTCDKQNPRYAYLAPFYAQAKDVVWTYLKEFAGVIPGVQFNESELRADFPNGGRIRLYGADNYDRLRGIYLDGVVLDEYADMDPRAWAEVIRPALSDRKGWAVFIGTPKGQNGFYKVWKGDSETGWPGAEADPEWLALMLKASETGLVDEEELRDARRTMTGDQYEQEFECSFEAAVIGAYYAKQMKRADEAKRIGKVPWEPGLEVHTAWDLGIGDSTAIWFAQMHGKEVRVIDFYEASGVGLDHYAKVLREKPYVYAEHILPHDVAVKELGTGKSRLEVLDGLGIRNVRVLPNLRIEDGINAARLFIERCWFDADNCRRGVEALKAYRAEYDEKLQVLKLRPLHNWASHPADAFRYLALGMRDGPANDWSKPIEPRTGTIA
jgi:hypothetical protein